MDINFTIGAGLLDSAFGKHLHPLKAVILKESDALEKKIQLVESMFEIQKSNHYGESYQVGAGIGEFMAIEEGGEPENDGAEMIGDKYIANIEFAKNLPLTRKAIANAKGKLAMSVKKLGTDLVSAWFQTRNHAASIALSAAEKRTVNINGTKVDLTTYDDMPLFSANHKWGGKKKSGTQSNLFYLNDGFDALDSVAYFEDVLTEGNGKIRNMKSEKGEPMGYSANIIRIPGNQLQLEKMLRKTLGSEFAGSIENATINTQTGKYSLFVDPFWVSPTPVIDLMSKDCSRAINGNIFQERTKLEVETQKNRLNMDVIGYGSFGLGFGNYKHIVRIYFLDDGATMDTAEKLG